MLMLAACSNKSTPDVAPIQTRVALESFDSCSDLRQYIADTAVHDMRLQLDQWKDGWGFGFGYGVMTAGGPAGATPSANGPHSFTKTNTQVAGVDEADFVKNDGTRIFVLTGDTLYINQSWPAASMQTVATMQIEGYPREMYLDEQNHLIVFSSIYDPMPWDTDNHPSGVAMCSRFSCGYYWGNVTKVTVIDVSDSAHPAVVSEQLEPGWYQTSRRVGESVRMVLTNTFNWPQGVEWAPPYDPAIYSDRAKLVLAINALEDRNESVIRSAPLEAWLPHPSYKAADGTIVQVPYACGEFSRSNAPTHLGLVSVATLDVSSATLAAQSRAATSRSSIITEPGEIYASESTLYLATEHWWWWPEAGQSDYTYLHAFDISDPVVTRYLGSGGVAGHIRNSYSMDEQNGYLRVATSIGTRVVTDPSEPWGQLQFTNRITVLGRQGAALTTVGQTPDIASGQQITGGRFIGSRAFLSTFQYVDPFLTFDLSDPTNPKPVGTLEVPGFSSYLHPLDANHVLAIGEYVPASGDSSQRSLQLSIFDVTDFAHPRQTFSQLVGTGWGWSEAQWDPHAFNYFADQKLLAIPYFDYDPTASNYWSGFISELRVFTVDPLSGFTPRGAITMKDVFMTGQVDNWTWYWTPTIRRSVMADNFVYAVADSGLRVADVNALSSPLSTVVFPPLYLGQ